MLMLSVWSPKEIECAPAYHAGLRLSASCASVARGEDRQSGKNRLAFLSWALVASLALAFLVAFPTYGASKEAKGGNAVLDGQRKQLAEYFTALEKARKSQDSELVSVLNFKINELLDQIVKSQMSQNGGPTKVAQSGPLSMASVKFEASEYATKKCDELRKTLVQLMRKSSPLKRRERSTFSELSDSEKRDLHEATREMNTVTEIMKARCAIGPTAAGKTGKKAKKSN
jgi:hypothetical protein